MDINPTGSGGVHKDRQVINKRAANRLAEVPRWDSDPNRVEKTCSVGVNTYIHLNLLIHISQDSGTSLPSDGGGDTEIDEFQQLMANAHVNRNWPKGCHYVPAIAGRLMCLKSQPPTLNLIIKAAIDKCSSDLVFDTAYRPVDELTEYFRQTLVDCAMGLRTEDSAGYSKRLAYDANLGKEIGRVVGDRNRHRD
jgi:hypothetical protein